MDDRDFEELVSRALTDEAERAPTKDDLDLAALPRQLQRGRLALVAAGAVAAMVVVPVVYTTMQDRNDGASEPAGPTQGFVPAVIDTEERRDFPAGELVGATLIEENDCLLLEQDDGQTALPVFPSGTEWRADAGEVVLPSGRSLRVGTWIDGLGGGYYSDPAASLTVFDQVKDDVERCIAATSPSTVAIVSRW